MLLLLLAIAVAGVSAQQIGPMNIVVGAGLLALPGLTSLLYPAGLALAGIASLSVRRRMAASG